MSKPNPLGDVAASLKKLEESVENAQVALEKHERVCGDCSENIPVEDDVLCNDCGAPVDCDGCGQEITSQGHCDGCYVEAQEKAGAEALDAFFTGGPYPDIGLKRLGVPFPDQLKGFLALVAETCCGSNPKPCARCQDAVALREGYVAQLGEVRA